MEYPIVTTTDTATDKVREAECRPSNSFVDNMNAIIVYCEKTDASEWCEDAVRTKDNRNCLLGHIFAMGKNDKHGNEWWNWFENCAATTYMVYPVNDKQNPKYQQDTAKERCLAYLRDLRDGKEKTTQDHFDDFDKMQAAKREAHDLLLSMACNPPQLYPDVYLDHNWRAVPDSVMIRNDAGQVRPERRKRERGETKQCL